MLGATQDVFHLVSFQSLPGKPLTYSQLILSQISGLHRMPGDSSTTWLTPPRRGPCLLSWWTSSGSCGRTVEFKPALTELQSSSSMTRHLSKTLGRRGGGGVLSRSGEISLSLQFQAVGTADPQTELKPMETFASPH